ncbi:MAG: SDR family NAD(P)-dependent oxidoreductase [Azospirillaceae bacterium]|nr:SDR family NAD(P)-dependent oxidoreductase [Azospirillaceae bacterium]
MADATAGCLAGRVALITGASRGIGAAVAKRLAAAGAHTVLAARTVGGLEEVNDEICRRGGSATLVPIDLRNATLIDQLGAALFERYGKLDILVANAAILESLGPVAHSDVGHWERVMSVNLMANYRLIRSLDPLLRASDAGRAIFVTADAARRATAYWAPYAVSKAALETLVLTYAAELTKSPVRVNLIDPGTVATALRARAFPGEDPATLPTPDQVTDAFLALADPACQTHGEIITVTRPAPIS